MKAKKILVTGGAGFIGSNLVRRLVEQGADTTLILRKNSNLWRLTKILKSFQIIRLDLLNKGEVKKTIATIKPDTVYHLAAYGAYSYQDEAEKIFTTDVFGTLNLLNACKDSNLELFVNTGSSSEYGFKEKPMKETEFLEPNSYYAIAKSAQTHLASYYAKTYKMPITTLRPFSVYGPYEEPGRLIPNIMCAFYRNKVLQMVSKKIVRDFIYIDDYIDACLNTKLLGKYPGEIFNIGTGIETNFSDLIKICQKVMGADGRVEWNASDGKSWDSNYWRANTFKSSKLLEFKAKYDLEEGLKKNWEWFKTNHQLYNENH